MGCWCWVWWFGFRYLTSSPKDERGQLKECSCLILSFSEELSGMLEAWDCLWENFTVQRLEG